MGKGFVEGCGRGRVALHGIVGEGKALDFVHAVGALLVNFDIPGNQVGLITMCRDAQRVDETLARPCVVHRTVGDAASNAVLNRAVQLLPVRSSGNGIDDALVVTELLG